MKFDTKNSIALSNFSIFLSSTQRYLLNSVKTHPLKDGRGIIVDLNIVLVCLPLIIMGVVVGYIINNIFPSTLILICYVLILTWVGWGLFVKTSKLRKEENLKF
jgi:undecaprenyl pyrophosphate phosphatase UppP